MATETKYIARCDRCGSKEETLEEGVPPASWSLLTHRITNPDGEEEKVILDLCSECKISLFQWINARGGTK